MKDNDMGIIKKNRYVDWVDSMKALLIIAVVVGHSRTPLVTYIYLFHMPAFFILSGYTYKFNKYKLTEFIRKKFFRILLPAILINVIYIIFYCIVQKCSFYNFISDKEPVGFQDRMLGLSLNLWTTDFGGATWFLFVLFEVQIIIRLFEAVSQKLHCRWVFGALILLTGSMGYFLVRKQKVLPYCLDLAFMACFYFGAGIFMSEKNLLAGIDRNTMLPICMIATIFFGSFYFYGKLPMNWPTREFADLFIQFISCFASFYLVYYAAILLEKVKYLQWLGRHTYCLLITHFVAFRLIFAIGAGMGILSLQQMRQLTPDAVTAANGGWILISMLTVLICSAIAWLAEKNPWTDYLINARYTNERKLLGGQKC